MTARRIIPAIIIMLLAAAGAYAAELPIKDTPYPQKFATKFAPGETPAECAAALAAVKSGTDAAADEAIKLPDVLPVEDVLARDAQGDYIWIGTSMGAARWDGGEWHYYQGPQYLADDRVESVAAMPDGGACLETPGGVTRVEYRMMTLEEKAALMEKHTRERHLRHNLVSTSYLKVPGDLSTNTTMTNDNDGLWTAMYVAAECFRYGATGDPEARENARTSFEAIMFLEDVNEIPGFVSRSFALPDEAHGGGEWDHITSDGLWRWKGDTSSDEIDGHFYVYSVYYDICATEEEKPAIREKVALIMDYIIENDYYLVDADGQPTTWGKWNPKFLNSGGIFLRGLNSLELLAYLKTAYHITGDKKYQKEYAMMIMKYGYGKNAILQKIDHPRFANHSDDELAFLVYYLLLKYEDHPKPLKSLVKSLERSWLIERPEKNPLFNFTYGAVMPGAEEFDAEDSVWMLRRIPMSLVMWEHKNSHRGDIKTTEYKTHSGEIQSEGIIPPEERAVMKWNDNPYVLDSGNNVLEEAGTFWLLPYWMGRYHGFIE